MSYYEEVSKIHDKSCACELEIKWNVQAITQGSNSSGYIVQHFSRKLVSSNFKPINDYKDISYYEAWKVKNGIIEYDDAANGKCDDRICIGMPLYDSSDFFISLDTIGQYVFTGDVYWIPCDTQLYYIVDAWSEKTVKQANGLKASYSFNELDKVPPVFSRERFVHDWDLSTSDKIYSAAKEKLFNMYRNNTTRDRNGVKSTLEEMLDGKYQDIANRILSEWENQWIKKS